MEQLTTLVSWNTLTDFDKLTWTDFVSLWNQHNEKSKYALHFEPEKWTQTLRFYDFQTRTYITTLDLKASKHVYMIYTWNWERQNWERLSRNDKTRKDKTGNAICWEPILWDSHIHGKN